MRFRLAFNHNTNFNLERFNGVSTFRVQRDSHELVHYLQPVIKLTECSAYYSY